MYTGNLTNAGFYSIAEIPDSTKINTLVRSTLQLLSFATDHEHTGGNDGDLIPAAGIENNAIITDKIKDDNVTSDKLAHGLILYDGVTVNNGGANITEGVTVSTGDINISSSTGKLKENGNPLVPAGVIMMWSGAITGNFDGAGLGLGDLAGWALCDGQSGRPNLIDKFIVGAGNLYAPGVIGGSATHLHSSDGGHTHTGAGGHTHGNDGSHSHTIPTSAWTVDTLGTQTHVNLTASTTNSAGGHTHNAIANHTHNAIAGHTHNTVSNLPPYWALAYIMKL